MKKEEDNNIIFHLLDSFRQKGGAWQGQVKARKYLDDLKSLLPEDEWWELYISHEHYLLGEGADELYDVCKKLLSRYEQTY